MQITIDKDNTELKAEDSTCFTALTIQLDNDAKEKEKDFIDYKKKPVYNYIKK